MADTALQARIATLKAAIEKLSARHAKAMSRRSSSASPRIRELDANSELLDPNSPSYDPHYFPDVFTGQFFASVAALIVLSLAISAVYWIVAIGRFGRTVGGLAVGVRAIDVNGAVPGYGRATVRWAVPASTSLLGVIPFVGFFGPLLQLLIYLWILWDPQRQGLHDKAAGTYVILDR